MLRQSDVAFLESAEWTENATVRALLNCYFREKGIPDPRTAGRDGMGPSVPGQTFELTFADTGATVRGKLVYCSRIGQHAYGTEFDERAPGGSYRAIDRGRLIGMLLADASRSCTPDQRERQLSAVRERVGSSMRNMRRYAEHAMNSRTKSLSDPETLDFIRSEQTLTQGHPFHPYPKSSEGFGDDELARFSPELGASFRLSYAAVLRRYVREIWVGEVQPLPPSAVALAKERLGERADDYAVLPMHPWQADYAMRQPGVRALAARNEIVFLGPSGPVFYPTSSVRTVWEPEEGRGYKLPLHVRITNLVRDNTPEQARRTLDAAAIIRRLGLALASERFIILAETGCSQVAFDSDPGKEWSPCFTVIHRPMRLPQQSTFVLASLLEPHPGDAEPKLVRAVRHGAGGRPLDWAEWLDRYLSLSLLPLLRIAAERGIGFEAHLQNSLISLKGGWPDRFYVRDLEGVSIDRGKAAEAGWIGELVADDSPVLYEEREVWLRTRYYFVVNHLGSLVHAIAAYSREDERRYWQVVNRSLRREWPGSSGRLRAYIEGLLHDECLPAKANLTSCMLDRGEKPSFVSIPNPIKEVEHL
ncbi:IucA/IucC family protein [Paenibacillaceae bacterium WGS1546]|uniref:IucA/IucC family protein n=1 Tax=Cohnella sp. WGS1546 TaxID=3366810 RepID=UPI00372D18C2